MFKNHFKTAWRNIWSRKLNTSINILGLTLGITCSMVIFICIKYEMGFDSFHSNSKSIYRVVEAHRSEGSVQYWNTTAYPLAAALRNDFPQLQVTQAAGPQAFEVSYNTANGITNRFQEDKVLFADSAYLQFFDFKKLHPGDDLWIAGNVHTAFINPEGVVLTASTADRYFPMVKDKGSIIGKIIKINNGFTSADLVITGIIKDPPANTSLLFDLLVNYEVFRKNNTYQANNWSGNYQGTTFLKLPPNIKSSEVEKRFVAFEKKYLKPEDDKNITYYLQPLENIHTDTLYGSSPGSYTTSKTTLWGLAGLAVFLILIASFNFINLATAQASQRSKEIGIRKVIGGTRLELFIQFITETLLVALISVLISLGVLYNLLSYINQHLSIINIHLKMDSDIIVLCFILIVLLTLLAGFYPSFILSGYKPITVLKNKTISKGKGLSLRHALIVLQFSIAFFLIVGTLVLVRQMQYFLNKDLGFTKDSIITINIPRQDQGKLDVLRQELLTNPAIKNLSYSSGAPTSTGAHYGTSFRLQEEPENMMRQAEMKVVDLNYLTLYNLQMVAGRWLDQANKIENPKDGFNGFVVNEAMVRMLGLKPEDAIGKEVIINEGKAPIVGVVKDFNNNSLQEKISPCLLFYWGSDFFSEAGIRLQANANNSNLSKTLSFIKKNWEKAFPENIYKFSFLDEALARNYAQEALISKAFQLFAAMAIVISCLGLFGLIVFSAEQRTKEVGVRKVLGASVTNIVILLLKDFLKPVFAAIIIASPVAWYVMNKWLQNFAYRINISWWIFIVAGLSALFIALLTVSFQSIKAAMANPVKSLRTE